MRFRGLVGLCCFLWLVGACTTAKRPPASGEVLGALRSIDIYPARSMSGEMYPTPGEKTVFASDGALAVALRWAFPAAGDYVTKVALRTPTGGIYSERELSTHATEPDWFTSYSLDLPQGEAAKPLRGVWQVEAFLDGTPAGRRAFTFDAGDIRLPANGRVLIRPSKSETSIAPGDWMWTNRQAAFDNVKGAHAILNRILRDEMGRRLPQVEVAQGQAPLGDASILVQTTLVLSPNLDTPSRVEIEITHVSTYTARVFRFQSMAGADRVTRKMNFSVAAADLALQGAADKELLQFLTMVAQLRPDAS